MNAKELIHMSDITRNQNVVCSNGSAHRRDTDTVSEVTCPECRKRLGLTN